METAVLQEALTTSRKSLTLLRELTFICEKSEDAKYFATNRMRTVIDQLDSTFAAAVEPEQSAIIREVAHA